MTNLWNGAQHNLCDPVDCSLPGSFVHGILQARILEWVAISFSRGSSRPKDQTRSPALEAGVLTSEPPGKPIRHYSVQFSSVAQSCLTLCDPVNRTMLDLSVHHQLLEFTQTHVHRVGDPIQPSDPLLSPSSPAPNPSQHQSIFQWVNSSHEVAKVLEFQLQHHSFQRTPRTDLLQNGLVGSPCSPRDSQESSPTPQFKNINSSELSLLHSPVILEPKKITSDTVSTVSPSISHEVMGPDAMIFVFWMLSIKPTSSLSSFTFIRGSLVLLHFLP